MPPTTAKNRRLITVFNCNQFQGCFHFKHDVSLVGCQTGEHLFKTKDNSDTSSSKHLALLFLEVGVKVYFVVSVL